MDELTVIICMKDRPGAATVPGTTKDVCAECGVAICIAPSGRAIAAESEKPVKLTCGPCGVRLLESDAEAEVMPLTAAQKREIIDALGGDK